MDFLFVISVLLYMPWVTNTDDPPGLAWVSRARIVDAQTFFINVMQELCYKLERRSWSSLRMIDINKTVDSVIANWHVNGTVTYTNGFVISIQTIDLSSFTSSVTRVIEDNVVIPTASVRGRLHFRHMKIGYDVIADIQDIGIQRYTGEILSNNIAIDFFISQNVVTDVITISSNMAAIEGSGIRMIYSPADHLTEVLSRNFGSSDNWNGVSAWRESFHIIIKDIIENKFEFPGFCFSEC